MWKGRGHTDGGYMGANKILFVAFVFWIFSARHVLSRVCGFRAFAARRER